MMTLFNFLPDALLQDVPVAIAIFLSLLLVGILLGRVLRERLLGVALLLAVANAAWVFFWLKEIGSTNPNPSLTLAREIAATAALLAWAALGNVLLKRLLWENYFRERRHVIVPDLLRTLASFVVFVIVSAVIVRQVFNISLGPLLAGSAILTAIIGWAMQDLLSNVVAGFSLHLEKAFKVGEWVSVAGVDGMVVEINWRATRLKTRENTVLIIPNGKIARDEIINYDVPTAVHAIHVKVGVDYDSPPNKVKEVLLTAARGAQGVLADPAPVCRVVEYASDSSVHYEIKIWIEDRARYRDIQDTVLTRIWYGLKRNGMTIPFPAHDIRLHQAVAKQPAASPSGTAFDLLKSVEFLAPIGDDGLRQLAAQCRHLLFARGELLIRQGEEGDTLFIIASGTASVSVHDAQSGEVKVGALKAGDSVGEMSLLTGERRGATVRAEEDAEVICLTKDALAPVLRDRPEIVTRLSQLVADRQLQNEQALKSAADEAETRRLKTTHSQNLLQRIRAFLKL